MEKLRMTSPDLTAANIAKVAEIFPSVVTETLDADGQPTRAIDFDALRQELSDHVVDGPAERYQLDWPGKREAEYAANAPIAKTLRPDMDASASFESTKNLFIEGDNLDALKLLQESYLGKVKLIYIDPPYNTGRDFIYDDDFSASRDEYLERSGQSGADGSRLVTLSETDGRYHSDWLSMMYPRLKLAKNLLRDDGVIFISIDDHEVDNLRKIATEVFGARNFVAQIIWQKVYAPKNSAQWFSEDHDYVLVYARNKAAWTPNPLPRTPEMEARYKNPDSDPRGPWKAVDMSARNYYAAGIYPVTTPTGRVLEGPPKGRYWAVSETSFRELDADGRIWWGTDGKNAPAVKRFLSEVAAGRTPQTLWPYTEVGHTQDAKKALLKYVPFEHTENVLNSVKPVELLQRVLTLATNPHDEHIVLDFFSGSGTTAHAVLAQNAVDSGNRRFIAVQVHEPLPVPEPDFDSILGMSLKRIQNVGAELQNQIDPPDVGYRLLRVDTTSMADVAMTPDEYEQGTLAGLTSSTKADRAGHDLLFQVLLDWGLTLDVPIAERNLAGHAVFDIDGGALVACFDEAIDDGLVRAVAETTPLRAVFRDSAFASDAARINAEQIFRELSPSTELNAL
jgi:adenine-specific DNA-methyltransferase